MAIDAKVNPTPIYVVDTFISSTIKSGTIERPIPKRMKPVLNEMASAIRYGLSRSASIIEVFSARFSGFAARAEPRSKSAAEILETAKSAAYIARGARSEKAESAPPTTGPPTIPIRKDPLYNDCARPR